MIARNLFADILRILTPDELSVLTTVSEGEQLFSLTEMMEREFVIPRLRQKSTSDNKAKILPFTKGAKTGEDRKVEAEALAKNLAEEIKTGEHKPDEVNDLKVAPTDEIFNDPDVSDEALEAKVIDLGDFIIKEKQRLKESQKKLKEQEVFGLYKKSASVDLEQEKLLKNDMSKSANGGILVNKKQL